MRRLLRLCQSKHANQFAVASPWREQPKGFALLWKVKAFVFLKLLSKSVYRITFYSVVMPLAFRAQKNWAGVLEGRDQLSASKCAGENVSSLSSANIFFFVRPFSQLTNGCNDEFYGYFMRRDLEKFPWHRLDWCHTLCLVFISYTSRE